MESKTKIGGLFELLFEKLFGAKKVPGSGNQPFRKMDNERGVLIWSLKATKDGSFRITKNDLQEVYEAAKGIGGLGPNHIAGFAICFVEGDEPKPTDKIVAVLDMHDLIKIGEEKIEISKPKKSQEKYERAEIPQLFRQAD